MKRTILIVEDTAANRRLLRSIVEKEYETFEADNGEEALAILYERHELISAVLMDIEMPVMDGFEALRRIRADAVLAQLPVIVVTGSQAEHSEVKALSLGANDFITKPYNPTLILHCLRNVINLRETASIVNAIQMDKLTGLYNREAFFDKATAMIHEHEPGYYVMACFDIDNFKLINDQYGVEEGDRILRHIGTVARDGVAGIGGIAGRISADNFAMLYPAGDEQIDFVTEMRDKRIIPADSRAAITLSVGRYIVSDLSLSASNVYDRAFIAKSSVKGRYDEHIAYFDESMLDKLIREQNIIDEMDAALATRQFEVWYQPQFNHDTGALIGSEALVRWRHPKRGLIPPGAFVPVFEQNGFIYELDKFVWEEVCATLRRWLDEGSDPLPVSVNISRYDIFRADLVQVISGYLERYDIPVELLRLEITESAFATSPEHIIRVVRRLMELGFTVEIDDFGSGYSSLNTLKDVPANVLKLDMRFLESNENSQRGGNILESVVRMAKWLDMSVIAEGVETREQADFLRSIGCNYIQGYLYARPMPVGQYEGLAHETSKEQRLLAMESVENLDNNAFWDPMSMDTLIFNSYVGGACIFEYHHDKIEFLRANKKYAQVIGNSSLSVDEVLRIDWSEHMDERSNALIADAIGRSTTENDEVVSELAFDDLPGCPHKTYLRATVRVIATAGERRLVYCTIENITAERQADQELRETDETLRFLNDMAHDLLVQPDGEKGIDAVLAKLMRYFDGNRAYIFEFNHDARTVSNTYEACAEGVASEKDDLQNKPIELLDRWIDAFNRHSFIDIQDVDALDESHAWERNMLLEKDIRSLFAVPLRRDGALIGMIGIDDPKQQTSRIDRMVALGDYIAVMLTHRDLDAKIINDNKSLQEFMNDMPGGFVRMRVDADGDIEPVYFNAGFCKMVGMSVDELMRMYARNAMAGVHPDDIVIVQDAVKRMLEFGEANSSRYRLMHADGSYLWLMIFGRATRNEAGEVFLNIYYTDVSDELRSDEKRKELLDNLPCGAALYEFDGKTLTAVHLNMQYCKLVGRAFADPDHVSVLNPIHPDDREAMIGELNAAIRESRDFEKDIRILYGNTERYRSFHLSGRILPKKGGLYAIYAACVPITDEALMYQEMLPVALSAVLSSSTDIAFVKDRSFRYVCCSRTFLEALGLPDEKAIIGKTDYELIDRSYADRYRKGEVELIAQRAPRLEYEELMPTQDGSLRYATTSKYPLMDSRGNVIGIYGVSRDITAARETDSMLKLLTDCIPGGLATYHCTPGAIEIAYFNDGFARLFGYTREEYAKISAVDALSRVFPEDVGQVRDGMEALRRDGVPMEQICRVRTKDGGFKWISCKAVIANQAGDSATVCAVLLDVTELQESIERLRISEEEHRLAVMHSGNVICRFNVADRTFIMSEERAEANALPRVLRDVPQGPVRDGIVSPETAQAYIDFFEDIIRGEKSGVAVYRWKKKDEWLWIQARSSTIFSVDGEPVSAVISFTDITEQQEKETVYKKWQQSLEDKDPADYTLFRANVSKDTSFDTMEGSLLHVSFAPEVEAFNDRTAEYVEQCVYDEDKERYTALINSDMLLASFYRGKRSHMLEYREKLPDGGVRWLRVTVDLVEYPNTTDVEAYMMYENINDVKRSELLTLERAEKDPLTGVLNRATFASMTEKLIAASAPDDEHALLMLDIDGFKMVNDVFGHAAGDDALKDVADALRSALRRGDLVGRLGGDEFIVFLSHITSDAIAASKAKQIGDLVRRAYSVEVQISASIGIVVCPRDGTSFDVLYKKADAALYYVKGSGKDHYAFYRDHMDDEHLEFNKPREQSAAQVKPEKMRRMLIVDDNLIDCTLLQNIFKDSFIIEKARDGGSALIRLRHYGMAISVVLLDLMMPGMDGFAVLERMRATPELQGIPVVVVSSADDHENSLRAIRCGASDIVPKPVDAELLRIRVFSAISKAENERLRARNSFLELQRVEMEKYRLALAHADIAVVEMDGPDGPFRYDETVSGQLAGTWDDRPLWDILASDGVTDEATVDGMRALVRDVAQGGASDSPELVALLRTPKRGARRYRVQAHRLGDEKRPGLLVMTLQGIQRDE